MRSKSAVETARTFKRMIAKRRPQKIGSDKETEYKGAFEQICYSEGMLTYTTQSETKSAFAERNIRSLKNIFYKYFEHKCTYDIQKLQSFVGRINWRAKRVTKIPPIKVTRKHAEISRDRQNATFWSWRQSLDR